MIGISTPCRRSIAHRDVTIVAGIEELRLVYEDRLDELRKQIRDRQSQRQQELQSNAAVLGELPEQHRQWEQDRRVLAESVPRHPEDPLLSTHGYGARMISQCVNVAQKVRLRAAQIVLRIVFEWLGLEQKIPDWTTIRGWMQRIGVAALEEHDEAIAIGIGPQSRLELTFGTLFVDVDLDGRLDIVAANGHLENEINKDVSENSRDGPKP